MSIVAVAAVPPAPLRSAGPCVRPGASTDEVAGLRDEVDATLRSLATADVVVLLAGGDDGVLHDRAVVRHRPPDATAGERELPVDTDLLAAVAGRGGFPRGRTDQLEGDLAALTLRCAETGLTGPVLPVEVPATASGEALDAVAAGLRGAAAATRARVGVLAAGSLASDAAPSDGTDDGVGGRGDGPWGATERGPVEFDRRAVAALEAGDHSALTALGPDFAVRVGARGWAGLVVASSLATGTDRRRLRYARTCGVGQVVLRA
jgi:hypothetical protein